jgi:hypothetical protein
MVFSSLMQLGRWVGSAPSNLKKIFSQAKDKAEKILETGLIEFSLLA